MCGVIKVRKHPGRFCESLCLPVLNQFMCWSFLSSSASSILHREGGVNRSGFFHWDIPKSDTCSFPTWPPSLVERDHTFHVKRYLLQA